MKQLLLSLGCACFMFAISASANIWEVRDNTVTGELLFDLDDGPDDDATMGFEVGFSQNIFAFDLLGVFVSHVDSDHHDTTMVGLSAETECSFIPKPLVPYLGAGVGYGWANRNENADEESAFVRGEVGTKWYFTEKIATNLGFRFLWSDEEIFEDEGGIDDKNWVITLGLQLTY